MSKPGRRLRRVGRCLRLAALGWTLATSAAAPVSLAAGQSVTLGGRHYVRERGVWYQEERDQRFAVDPRVVSVRFLPGVEPATRQSLLAAERAIVLRENRIGVVDLQLPAGTDPLELVQRLRASGSVEFAEVNTRGVYLALPDDPLFTSQWAVNNTGQTGGSADADIDGPEAWDLTRGDPSVIVAVLDSGTDIDHQDLTCNIWVNPGEDLDADGVVWDTGDLNGVDDDGNGLIDDITGWDFNNGNNDPRGPFFHGTHVAGIIGACGNNGLGITGVAGGWASAPGARLLIVGVGDTAPNGAILDDAILYAAAECARVITMSLGVGTSSAIDAALASAYADGVFIDNSAGNSGGALSYPATHPDVVAVGATDDNDQRASFSAFGADLELTAPGVDILSTQIGSSYGTSSGTSFASPHVAGVAGLMFSLNPGATNQDVRNCLTGTAEDQVGGSQDTPGRDDFYGWGRIDARAALECIGTSAPGEVSNLMLRRETASPGSLILAWDASCSDTAQNYAIYSGVIGQWYNHVAVDCFDDGADRTERIGPGLLGSRYYLVVPVDAIREGSYGRDSAGHERPQGTLGTCRSSQSVQGCR